MEIVQLELDNNGRGRFVLTGNGKPMGEMQVDISGNELTVFHTQVIPEAEGKGLAKKLLDEMVDYSRKNNLKVTAYCPYVLTQFKHRPDEYSDIWKNKSYGIK